MKVYRVDLMKLYLLQKNLSGITGVNLTGITPTFAETVKLGDGKDYADKSRYFWLPQIADKPGAYLVVVRGENIHRSGMVLVSSLTLEVQEDAGSGRVRVNVRRAGDGAYAAKVHVKAVGRATPSPRPATPTCAACSSPTTSAARSPCWRRTRASTTPSSAAPPRCRASTPPRAASIPARPAPKPAAKSLKAGDYLDNVNKLNDSNLGRNKAVFERDVFNNDKKGVQVQQAQ